MNKTWAISSWISFLISVDMFVREPRIARHHHPYFGAVRRADKIRQSRLGRSRLTYSHTSDMACHMKTTLNIDDTVMNRLRREAARQRKTMSESPRTLSVRNLAVVLVVADMLRVPSHLHPS